MELYPTRIKKNLYHSERNVWYLEGPHGSFDMLEELLMNHFQYAHRGFNSRFIQPIWEKQVYFKKSRLKHTDKLEFFAEVHYLGKNVKSISPFDMLPLAMNEKGTQFEQQVEVFLAAKFRFQLCVGLTLMSLDGMSEKVKFTAYDGVNNRANRWLKISPKDMEAHGFPRDTETTSKAFKDAFLSVWFQLPDELDLAGHRTHIMQTTLGHADSFTK